MEYMITQRGIEAHPKKIKSLATFLWPRNFHEVQKLTVRIVPLSRFINFAADWALSFFKILHKNSYIKWNVESEKACKEIKCYMG